MKKIRLLLLFIANIGLVQAQYTAIPDTCFEQHLIDLGIDSEGTLDGQVLTADVNTITSLTMHGNDHGIDYGCYIHSLEGIDAFVALEKLDISPNGVEFIDLSNLPNLKQLNCSDNFTKTLALPPSIEIVFARFNMFTQNIDLSQTIHLKELHVDGFYASHISHINNIDVHNCPELVELTADYNDITSIDVHNCPELVELTLIDNNITSIDVSNNPLLEILIVSDDLTTFIHNNPNLKRLGLFGDFPSINIDEMINLEILGLGIHLTSLNIDELINLKQLYIIGNSIPSLDLTNNIYLKMIDVINDDAITTIDIRNGNNNNLTRFHIENSPNLTCIYVDDAQYCNINWPGAPYFAFEDNNTFVETEADCDALAVNEAVQNNFAIYPNPVQNILHIEHNNAIIKEIIVYNILGKEIIRTSDNTIDLSTFSNGVYVVKIKTADNKSVVKKIIKVGV